MAWWGMSIARYAPPAVHYRVHPYPQEKIVWLGAWIVVGGLLCGWWVASGPQPLWRGWTALVVWMVAGAGCWQGMSRSPRGVLAWDGAAWWWQPDGAAQALPLERLEVLWDGQRIMLLQWRAVQHKSQHAWLSRSVQPWRWGDWRRAVYSSAASRAADERL